MNQHAKASSAGSTEGAGKSRDIFRRAFATRGASGNSGGTGAPFARRFAVVLFALLAGFAFAAASASAAPPVVKIGTVANLGYTTAEVSGEVNAGGSFAGYSFEYSTDGSNWTKVNGDFAGFSESGTLEPVAPVVITGLKPSTKYFIRMSATNFSDPEVFSDEPNPEFTTLGPIPEPTVTIDPVSTFTDTTAHFSGEIDPGAANNDPGFIVHWHFECEPACLSLTEGAGEFGDDGEEHEVKTDAGIEPNTAYTIKLVAENAGGTETAQTTFHSSAPAPVVETISAFAFGNGTEALIGGKVNPKNQLTKYWLEYGPGPGGPGAIYPSSIPADHEASAGSGAQVVFGIQEITGLSPASTYHFRIAAENATGINRGEDVSFNTLALPSPPPASCPNDKLRSETNSEALGECRAYEVTTPVDKNGGDASNVLAYAPDGNRLGYMSQVAFGGSKANNGFNSYLAQRSSTGWVSRALQPPVAVPNYGPEGGYSPADFSSDLSNAIIVTRTGVASEQGNANVFSIAADGSPTWVTAPNFPTNPTEIADKAYAGRSADGSRIFFESPQSFDGHSLGASQVWEWVDGQVRLVSIMPGGDLSPEGAALGNGSNGNRTVLGYFGNLAQPTVVSEDGSRVFFGQAASFSYGIFVRENGAETRRLDLSQRAGSVGEPSADPGQFIGAAADGSVVVFGTTTQLTDDATVNGGYYAYDLETEQLRFLSAGATDPAGAQVEGVSQISKDGSHVYFAARSVLVPGKGVQGGNNLYVADQDGVRYIATLAHDDAAVWNPDSINASRISAQVTPDGRHFVFPSYERLTAFDNANHNEVYLYAAGDGSITCVSCGDGDQPATGDASIQPFPAVRGGQQSRAFGRPNSITPDGSRVLFETTQALVPGDVNGREDVYLYRDGRVSLISAGTGEYNSEIGGITPDGASVFFLTRDSLVGQDTDGGGSDAYGARIDGGFPAPPVANPCEGEAGCQGKPSAAPGFSSPASIAPGRGNPPGRHKKKPQKKACKGKAKEKHAKCGQKKTKKHNASKSGRGK